MKKDSLKFCLLLAFLLAIVYIPRIRQEGGILFNVIQDITGVYGFPGWDKLTNHELRAGLFPLWNPYNALGEPHLANMQSAVFYPLTWVKVLFNVNFFAYDILLVIRLFLAGLFMWWFLGEFKLSFLSRAFGATSFAMTGYFVRHVYMSHLNVEILLPLSMMVFGELARIKTARCFLFSVFVAWLTIVGGFPEATLYVLSLSSLWYLYCHERPRVRGIPTLIGALFLGVIASTPQLLPFVEYMHNSWTYHQSGLGYGHTNYRHFWSLIVPWFFGENNVSPLEPFVAPYLGTAVALLALAGAIGRERKKVKFFTFFAIATFGIIHGIFPFILIGTIYPFSVTLNFKYAMPSLAFCISVLASFGMQELLEDVFSKPLRRCLGTAVVLILLAVSIFNHRGSFWYSISPYWILVACGIIILLALTAVAPIGKLKMVGGALLLFSLILPTYGAKGIVNKDFLEAPTTIYGQFLVEHHREARFGSDFALLPNTNLSLMLNDIRYYNPMYVKRYAQIFARAETGGDEVPSCLSCVIANNFSNHSFLQPSTARLNEPLWEKMGLSFWVGSAPGRESILRSLVVEGDWYTSRKGMIARTKLDDSLPVLFAHSPSEIVFLTYLSRDVKRLVFIPAIDKRASGKSDGVLFQIKIVYESEYNPRVGELWRRVLYSRFFTPQECERKEVKIEIPEDSRDKRVAFFFTTTPGPVGDDVSDWSAWGRPAFEFEETGNWKKVGEDIYVQDIPFGYLEMGEKMEPKVTVNLISSQKILAKCHDCPQGRIVVPYVYYPGWRAYRGTEEMKITPAEGALLAVEAKDDVEFIYKPFSFKVGLWCLVVSLLTIPLVLVIKD